MKKSLLLLALLAAALSVRAQDNAARLALAHEAIAAMHADKMLDSMTAQMKQMATQLAPQSATATPEERQKAGELQTRIMDLTMTEAKGLIAKMDAVYAEVYSEAELKAMVAFFTSPEGQSMLAKQPQVMTHLMPLIQDMQRNLMPRIQKLVEETRAATPAK